MTIRDYTENERGAARDLSSRLYEVVRGEHPERHVSHCTCGLCMAFVIVEFVGSRQDALAHSMLHDGIERKVQT